MLRWLRGLLLLVLTTAWVNNSPAASAAAWRSKVDASVLQTAARGPAEFLVVLTEQGDLSAARTLPDKLSKGMFVYQTLSGLAARTQPPLWAILERAGAAYRSFWIVNMIWARGDLALVQTLAQRSEVAHIDANPTLYADLPPLAAAGPLSPAAIEWNINKANAPQVWAAGYTGQGVVIGGADTGYVWNHPALIQQYRGWDGATAHHDYNWFDATAAPSPSPIDPYGHGTHTMGTMLGSDNPAQPLMAAHAVGMAPGAQWIGCRNMDASGAGTPATYIACYEWFVAPYPVGGTPAQGDPAKAPHVINNSWGCTASEGCTAANWDILLAAVQAVRAAGIVTVHSAGNYGSGCATISEPAAIYAESFTVGATDSADAAASFSSRGPVTVDGSNRIKPNVSAPGLGIVSTTKYGGYGSMSGTSMAAPHVAGLAALLISAQPRLAGDVEAIETLIEQSARPLTSTQSCGDVPGASIPNNTYGWGRIDAYAALSHLPHSLQIAKTASASLIAPGQTITYTLTVTHAHPLSPTANIIVSDTLPAGAAFVSATPPYTLTGDVVQWKLPSLQAHQSASVQLVVQAILAEGNIVNQHYGAVSDDVPWVIGAPITTSVVDYSLALAKTAPARVAPGGVLTYTLTVTNLHPTAAQTGLVLTDTLPSQVDFVSASEPYTLSAGTIQWQKSALAAGQAWSVQIAVQVPMTFTGTITNADFGVASQQASERGQPVASQIYGLALSKHVSAAVIAPGQLLTYTLVVTNLHPLVVAHSLVLSDVLPAETVFVAASGQFTLTGQTVRWDWPELGPAQAWAVTLTVRVEPTARGIIRNDIYAAVCAEVERPVWGAPVETQIRLYRLFLPFIFQGGVTTLE